MNHSRIPHFWPVLALLAAASLACSLPSEIFGVEITTPTLQEATLPAASAVVINTPSAPAPALTPTEAVQTPFEVSTGVVKQENKEPPFPYIIGLEYPQFSGAPEAAAADLNQQVDQVIARVRAGFDEMVKTPTPAEYSTGPHGLNMRYEVRYNDGKYVSVYFQFSQYNSGAAHPLPFSQTLTYDVANQRVLQLGDLFEPGTDYLTVLSERCIAYLHSKDITGGEAGAAPVAENYQNWNITANGLVITFDPYQVAAYALGYVPVVIPWTELSDILAINF